MKTIQSNLLGKKNILATDPSVQLFQIREVLNSHRDSLINRLMEDIPLYLAYRFEVKASPGEVDYIREKLLKMQSGNVDLGKYGSIIRQVQTRMNVKLTNELFYKEIDEVLMGVRNTKLNFA